MSRGRVLFRADASHAVGFGHVARLCALIEESADQGYEAIALFGGDATAVGAWARDRKLVVEVRDWSATQVVQAAADARVIAVVVDGPAIAREVVPQLPPGVRSVVIDDMGGVGLAASTVVNHNFHAPALAATYAAARQRLLGRGYLMLRKDIRRYPRGACRPGASERLRVVVTYGGSDPVGATQRTLRLIPPDRPLALDVIAGPGFRDDDGLRTAIAVAIAHGHVVEVHRSPADPGALFVSADAAICSAGGTLGELAYLGCPTLAFAIVPDQVATAGEQVRAGIIAGGRRLLDADDATIRADLLRFLLDDAERMALRERALATADGDGVRRIVEEAIA